MAGFKDIESLIDEVQTKFDEFMKVNPDLTVPKIQKDYYLLLAELGTPQTEADAMIQILGCETIPKLWQKH